MKTDNVSSPSDLDEVPTPHNESAQTTETPQSSTMPKLHEFMPMPASRRGSVSEADSRMVNLRAKLNPITTTFQEIRRTDASEPISTTEGIVLTEGQKEALTNGRLFEAGVSMSILDHPGDVGKTFDQYGHSLNKVLGKLLTSEEAGGAMVHFNGAQKPLRDVLQATMFSQMSATCDQIGRMPEQGDVKEWLQKKLSNDMVDDSTGQYKDNHNFKDLLTKVKATAAFGTTVWQLLNVGDATKRQVNEAALKQLLEPVGQPIADSLGERFDEFKKTMRTERFDDGTSRMRSERPPLSPNGSTKIDVHYESAATYGLGFGYVAVRAKNEADQPQLDKSLNADRSTNPPTYTGINAARREGAPIESGASNMPERPFMMSREEINPSKAVMNVYKDLKFKSADGSEKPFLEALAEHHFPHGAGVNRWQPVGTFAVESNLRGLPSAGSQSGGTCDILLGLNLLSEKPLYGNHSVVEPATLGIAAFMNFGGYHTFGETVAVGMAMANGDDEFNPTSGTKFIAAADLDKTLEKSAPMSAAIESGTVDKAELEANFFGDVSTNVMHENLYERVSNMAAFYTNVPDTVHSLREAYATANEGIKSRHPNLELDAPIKTVRE
ncbi:hypothetical protein AB1286_21730 [Trinickia sp. NRRL B-1857]|uniref:hypothetical protein n=1 Tax=Trinickia sp. NRRL B-1857 TaxID=3162879 RepID=UPI003D27FCC1